MTTADKFEWPQGRPLFELNLRAIAEALAGNGISASGDFHISATANDMEIQIAQGTARYNGSDYTNGGSETIVLPTGDSSYDRWDLVYFDIANTETRVRNGSASQYPEPPALGSSELLLGIVLVPATATNIDDSHILNWRAEAGAAGFTGSHTDLSDITSDDHHTRYADSEAISAINNDADHGSTAAHNYFSGSHADLSNVGSDDHHPQAHAHDGTDGSGQVDHSDLLNVNTADHHTRYADSEAIDAINNDPDHGSTAAHNYYTDSAAITAVNNDADHGSTAAHNYTTSVTSITDIDVEEIQTGTLANRPSSTKAGIWYFTTDENGIFFDTGSGWRLIAEHPGNITENDLAFDPVTQTELDTHSGNADAHHPRAHDNNDHTTNYTPQTTYDDHAANADAHHAQEHDNSDHSTNYATETDFTNHKIDAAAHHAPDQSAEYAAGGNYEIDAAELAGRSGDAGAYLRTDGDTLSWEQSGGQVVTTSTDKQLSSADTVLVDTTDNEVVITIPTDMMKSGNEITVKDIGGNVTTNPITVQTGGAEQIDGADTVVIDNAANESIEITTDGTNWYITGHYGGGL